MQHRDCIKETVLCRALSSVDVPLITITSRINSDATTYHMIKPSEFDEKDAENGVPLNKRKKYCIVGGRVHPGETPGSWMMQGFLKCITGDSY